LVIPIAFVLSYTEPTPIVYEQQKEYNHPVNLVTSVDEIIHIAEATSSSEEVVFVPEPVVKRIECYCVTYLRERLGVNIRGDADSIRPNVDHPISEGVVLFNYGHAAKIKYVMGDRLLIQESNFKKCTPTERVVMLDDPAIRGFYFKNPNIP